MKKTTIWILSALLFWFILLQLTALNAGRLVAYEPSFPYAYDILAKFNLPQWYYSWAGFDGVHYLTIALNGYKYADLTQAFFPLFPGILSVFESIGLNPIAAGLILNLTLLTMALILFYKLVKLDFSYSVSKKALLALLLFPTSFFFISLYTESLFLLTVIGAFLAARRGRWLLAAGFTILATSSRLVGIMLVPALIMELYLQKNNQVFLVDLIKDIRNNKFVETFVSTAKNNLRTIALIGGGSLGLIIYMSFLYREFGDPLYFYHVQSEFGGGRQENLIMYPQVVWRYINILITARPFDWKYYSYILEAIAGVGGFFGLMYALKHVRLSYVFFSLGIFIIPTLTGTFSSLPRYLLPAFAIYILLAKLLETHTISRYTYFGISMLLLVINTMLFIQGYWVS